MFALNFYYIIQTEELFKAGLAVANLLVRYFQKRPFVVAFSSKKLKLEVPLGKRVSDSP
jgi:hypothetical protein